MLCNSTGQYVYECSDNLRCNLMHDLGGRVFQRVLQVVLEVAEELPGSSLHHIQQSPAIIGIHLWGQRTFSQSESRRGNKIHTYIDTHTVDANKDAHFHVNAQKLHPLLCQQKNNCCFFLQVITFENIILIE